MADKVIVAVVQMEPQLGMVAENCEKVLSWADESVRQGAQLLVFPECALTGYCFESRKEAMEVAEPVDGARVRQLVRFCADRKVWMVVGTLEREGEWLFNAALLLGPDGVHAVYRKVHLPCLGVDRFVDAGDQPFQGHKTPLSVPHHQRLLSSCPIISSSPSPSKSTKAKFISFGVQEMMRRLRGWAFMGRLSHKTTAL